MTAKERLIEAVKCCIAPDCMPANRVAGSVVVHLLAHPALLLAVLAETGVLTEETREDEDYVRGLDGTIIYEHRFLSPWVPSGDQT